LAGRTLHPVNRRLVLAKEYQARTRPWPDRIVKMTQEPEVIVFANATQSDPLKCRLSAKALT
jgi:hypothetical protein